uniref:zinc finger CCCH domain-containing protein 3 n=1 Tax=Doryrhamphus excisus TaxID=161450 RepID=UPI0025AE5F6B|nr:zinc finger CCCH domain-containing protein 3 [Doryrhamphus excisus]
MEERESLKRQIDLLQSLINKHKSVHGDAPRTSEASTSSRWRSHNTSVAHPHNSRRSPYTGQSHGSWRKTYSLKNKNPLSVASTSSSGLSSTISHSSGHSVGEASGTPKPSTASLKTMQQKDVEGRVPGIRNVAGDKNDTPVPQPLSVARCLPAERQQQKLQEPVATKVKASPASNSPSKGDTVIRVPRLQNQTSLGKSNKTHTEYLDNKKQTLQNESSSSQVPLPSQAVSQSRQVLKSKFRWVKNQSTGGTQPSPSSSTTGSTSASTNRTLISTLGSKAASLSGSFLSSSVVRRTPGRKLTRKSIPVFAAPRTSRYQWVRSQAKTPRKPPSPKAPTRTQRSLEKGETPKRMKPTSFTSTKPKRKLASPGSSLSRYCWKAGGSGAGWEAASHRRSSFVWTSDKNNKGARKVLPACTAAQSSPSAFKLRSRMKIIRGSDISGRGSVKVGVPSGVKHSPRGRLHSAGRVPTGPRRTPTRELVSFGRHKLRRVSPTSWRTSPGTSFHSTSASQRICRAQYKKVNCPGSSYLNTLPYNASLSWRAKKIQLARSFLQSRQRPCHNRYPAAAHHWKGSGVCWIRGSLYQVSANKLSRKVGHNMSINRTGRAFNVSPGSSPTARSNSSRHLASRAVQRSLAIIRQARQKKQQRQYCMYYNRFGKCNRGSSCPYIHDPDKVAVCTRFLRGTCKQADGSCPFSHKVAKEKMPVCSYFLKGICNNSDCPYSHVYVSHKAKVCEDFVKGYCPEGEKCKKKHTLLCPDFTKTGSCPRGSRCKLQHRQRTKRSTSTPVRPRNKEPSKSLCRSEVLLQGSQETPGTSAASLLELPSFISLSSSPEEPDTPDLLQAKTSQSKDKKLQIKPRL